MVTHSSGICAFELLEELVDETVVEVLTTKVSITSSGLDLGDEDVVLFETISHGSGGGLVDDARTLRPAMVPASLIAWRLEMLEYAGTVTIA